MSKAHRGRGLRAKPNHGRGTCPLCKRTGIKLIYEREIDKVKVSICKICNSSKKKPVTGAAEKPKEEPAAT